MQDLTIVARNNATAFQLLSVVLIFIVVLTGCETPGSVGSGIGNSGTEVRIDTFSVSNIQAESFIPFTGRLSFLSAGKFEDPLFGDLSALSLVRPDLPRANSVDSVGDDARMFLRMVVDQDNIYGDTLSTAEFDLIEIDEIWRSKTRKLNDDIRLTQQVIGSFEVGQEDTLNVELDSDWTQRYGSYFDAVSANRDSLYLYDFHGLAIVPKNTAKIIPVNPTTSRFYIRNQVNDSTFDTTFVSISDWAYSLDRTNESPAPAGSFKALSTLEQALTFDMDLTADALGTFNISRVELVFHQNEAALDSSINQSSASAARPGAVSAGLYAAESVELPEALDRGQPIDIASLDDNGTYRFDITNFTNGALREGIEDKISFYLVIRSNNGIIRSSLLYNNEASAGKRPKIIVTSTKTTDN